VDVRGAEVVTVADEEALAREAAWRMVEVLKRAIAQRGEAHLALTGGSSAVALYRELVQPVWHDQVAWQEVHLWWGDERMVPVDHPESNAGLAYSLLLAIGARTGESGDGAQAVDVVAGVVPGLPILAENVHPYQIDEALSESSPGELVAERYAEELIGALPAGTGGVPAFDVVLLGIGGDGHIMSVFPGSPLIDDGEALVGTVPAPTHIDPHMPRVTLSPRLLPAAGLVLVMVSGADKAEVVASVLGGSRDPARWPAQLAVLPNSVWLLDRAAAAKLSAVARRA
jgi:6-phosphogluconolactonase